MVHLFVLQPNTPCKYWSDHCLVKYVCPDERILKKVAYALWTQIVICCYLSFVCWIIWANILELDLSQNKVSSIHAVIYRHLTQTPTRVLVLFSLFVRFEGRSQLSEALSSTPPPTPHPHYIHVYNFLQVWPPACIQKCVQVSKSPPWTKFGLPVSVTGRGIPKQKGLVRKI